MTGLPLAHDHAIVVGASGEVGHRIATTVAAVDGDVTTGFRSYDAVKPSDRTLSNGQVRTQYRSPSTASGLTASLSSA